MTVHIIGAGLAGLSCALASADRGFDVVLHESAKQPGGRCRSWFEPSLERVVDNGTHMVVGANQAVFGFLRRIRAEHLLTAGPAALPMLDLSSGRVWTARPSRLVGTVLAASWRLPRQHDKSIADALGRSRFYRRFWDPLALAIMNTPSDQASALVFRRVVARTLWRGAAASQPFLANDSLADSFVTPAVTALERAGATLRFNHPLRGLERSNGYASRLLFDDQSITLTDEDRVVLALPWMVARQFIPELPDLPASPIINGHFRLASPPDLPQGGFLGLLGGTAQWLFVKHDLVSVTLSGAGALVGEPSETLAALFWADIARALKLSAAPLAHRIIKEKRATLFHSPLVEQNRPPPRLADNLVLAGDWTATGLPCTLEGALTSGGTAAGLL